MSLLKRLGLWTLVCAISAGPSFFFGAAAYEGLEHACAMLAGIGTFIIFYTWVTGTKWFAGFRQRPFVDRTLKIGFGTRVLLSIVFPIAIYPDIICGMISIMIVTGDHSRATDPFEVYVITLTQGTILNIILCIYMLGVWGLQRVFLPKPQPHGLCHACGYDLRASRDVCPECGTPIAPDPTPPRPLDTAT